jgi:hypothetical protein
MTAAPTNAPTRAPVAETVVDTLKPTHERMTAAPTNAPTASLSPIRAIFGIPVKMWKVERPRSTEMLPSK